MELLQLEHGCAAQTLCSTTASNVTPLAKTLLLRLAVALATVFVWQASWRLIQWNERLFPPPSKVFATLAGDITSGALFVDVWASLKRVAIGYAAGASLGILFGVFTGTQKWADAVFGSLFQLVRPIPPIALVPLVIVWFGIGETGKVLLVIVGVMFPVWLNTHLGVSAISTTHLYLVQSLRAGYWSQLWNIWLPGAAGSIAAGLRVSVALGFYCLIAAEMTGALHGLAYRIELAHLAFRVDRMLGHMIVLGVLSFFADTLTRLTLSKLLPWTVQPE